MKTTGNLGLKKPEGTDIVDINDLNSNMDILDTAVKAVQDHAADTVKHITATERTAWNAKAPLASPAFTGTPTTPTPAAGANNQQIANAAFVAQKIAQMTDQNLLTTSDVKFNELRVDNLVAGTPELYGFTTFGNGFGDAFFVEVPGVDAILTNYQGKFKFETNGGMFVDDSNVLTAANHGNTGDPHSQYALKGNAVPQTVADMTFYVSVYSGSDSNNGLSPSTQLKTLGRLFRDTADGPRLMPMIINHTVNVVIADGVYPEVFVIEGFSGSGKIVVNSGNQIRNGLTVRGMMISQCACQIDVAGITMSTDSFYEIAVYACIDARLNYLKNVYTGNNPVGYGVSVYNSNVRIVGSTISKKANAVWASFNSNVYIAQCTGSSNNFGVVATNNAKVYIEPDGLEIDTFSPDSKRYAIKGGIINFTVNGVISVWGDNSYNTRAFSNAIPGNYQDIAMGQAVKLKFLQEEVDLQNIYDAPNSRFIAPRRGLYDLKACIMSISGVQSGTTWTMSLYKNGQLSKTIAMVYNASTQNQSISGATNVFCENTGDYLEIYFSCSGSGTLRLGSGYFQVAQIA